MEELNNRGYFAQDYIGELTILIRGKFLYVVSDVAETTALLNRGGKVDLNINPHMYSVIQETKKRRFRGAILREYPLLLVVKSLTSCEKLTCPQYYQAVITNGGKLHNCRGLQKESDFCLILQQLGFLYS